MNYSEMTDFEINSEVASKVGGFLAKDIFEKEQTIFKWHPGNKYSKFDPCKSWADAGPIIEKENISLTCHQSRDEWAAIFNRHCMAANNNPLRAAMECFLMKKERENAA
ncbi:phage protein NinX family protein [Pantoea agglomerans]|uniref:phage protein NinX family protein n=1 Tax=Enterobacter agglomerans TaxID=549 RepID=UPI003C7E79F7